jgi:uncharacterized protein YaiL (DUF2058 family)
MQSLRDKLLQAGLVSEEAAKKAEAEKAARPTRAPDSRPPRRDGDRGPRPERGQRDERPRREAAAPVPKLPPLPGSKEANRQAARKQLELDRAIRELVLANAVPPAPGETAFYFVTRKNKLRRLELSAEQAKQLEQGELAVVERPDPDRIEHALVPPAIAEQLLTMSERAVRFLAKPGAQVGFLTEEEIHQRAAEADEPQAPEAPAAAEPAPAEEPGTFITVRRAPLS